MKALNGLIFVLLLMPLLVGAERVVNSSEVVRLDEDFVLRYGNLKDGKYFSLSLFNNDRLVRVFASEEADGGAFDLDRKPPYSPDKKFIQINQVESGSAVSFDGVEKLHEVAYCSLIELHSGCIVDRRTGEFCAGNFTTDGKWDSGVYPKFDLAGHIKKAKKYAEERIGASNSPEGSLENLIACDPPNDSNIDDYRKIFALHIFNASPQVVNKILRHLPSSAD